MRAKAFPLVLLSITTLLAGCDQLLQAYESPRVSVSSFNTVPSGGPLPAFEIGLRVVNPNAVPLKLDGLTYTIQLQGEELINGIASELPEIAAYGESEVKLRAQADLLGATRLISQLLRAGTTNVNYAFEAKLDLAGLAPTLRVRDEGNFSLQ